MRLGVNAPTNNDLIVKVLSISEAGILVHDGNGDVLVSVHHFQGRKGSYAKLRSITKIEMEKEGRRAITNNYTSLIPISDACFDAEQFEIKKQFLYSEHSS